ncbi:hypothetical protein G6F24_018486 [Rhizopus arrhizus]|nr:hypothetical protein G6F24_018486 [Rhizopus arrhizus]
MWTPRTTFPLNPLENQFDGMLHEVPDFLQEPRAQRAVHHAVIGGQRQAHHVADRQRVAVHHRLARHGTRGQNG